MATIFGSLFIGAEPNRFCFLLTFASMRLHLTCRVVRCTLPKAESVLTSRRIKQPRIGSLKIKHLQPRPTVRKNAQDRDGAHTLPRRGSITSLLDVPPVYHFRIDLRTIMSGHIRCLPQGVQTGQTPWAYASR